MLRFNLWDGWVKRNDTGFQTNKFVTHRKRLEPILKCTVTLAVFRALKKFGLDPLWCVGNVKPYLGQTYDVSKKASKFEVTTKMDALMISYWKKMEHVTDQKDFNFVSDAFDKNGLKPFKKDFNFIESDPMLYSLGDKEFDSYCTKVIDGEESVYIEKQKQEDNIDVPPHFLKLKARMIEESPTLREFEDCIRIQSNKEKLKEYLLPASRKSVRARATYFCNQFGSVSKKDNFDPGAVPENANYINLCKTEFNIDFGAEENSNDDVADEIAYSGSSGNDEDDENENDDEKDGAYSQSDVSDET